MSAIVVAQRITKKVAIGLAAILTISALLGSTVFAATIEISGNGANSTNTITLGDSVIGDTNNTSDCIPTDVKGSIQYTGNHLSGNPVNGSLVNIASNPDCNDDVYIHVFGSHQEPESDGWLESQSHVMTEKITVPQDGIDKSFQLMLPDSDYCWYQVDTTRTQEVKIPPTYNGDDMIEYVFVQNKEVCGEDSSTPTPTATPSATVTDTPTPSPTNNTGGGSTTNSGKSDSQPTKTVESIKASVTGTSMAPTGGFMTKTMYLLLTTGMMVTALGAVSYAKDKKIIS